MPPLISARTCWRAGWVAIVLGVVVYAGANRLAEVMFSSSQPAGSAWGAVYSAVSLLPTVLVPAGVALLVGSVLLRRVEVLTAALVASGVVDPATVEGLTTSGVREPSGRAADGDVDLDDPDVVDHEPGVR